MAKSKKKNFRQEIEKQLITTFDGLGQRANPKKFRKSIKKASKILSRSLESKSGVGAKKQKEIEPSAE